MSPVMARLVLVNMSIGISLHVHIYQFLLTHLIP